MTDDEKPYSGDGNPTRVQSSNQRDGLGPVSGDYAYLSGPADAQAHPDEVPVTPQRPTASKTATRAVREIVETLLLALLIFVAVRAVVLNFRVDGNSMVPNLHNE